MEERREGAHLLNLDGALDEIGKDMCILRHPKTDSYSLMMDARRVSDMLMSRSLWNNASLDTVSNASALSPQRTLSPMSGCLTALRRALRDFTTFLGLDGA